MNKFYKYNLVRAPVVLLIRTPIILLMYGVSKLGKWADDFADFVDVSTPHLVTRKQWGAMQARKAKDASQAA